MNPSKLSESLSRLVEKYSLSVIYTFGSRSKEALDFVLGRNRILDFKGSDLDIGVQPQPAVQLSVHQKVDLAAALEDLFEAQRVDLVVLPEADPFLAANIIRGERLYCRDETEADEYELYVLRRAGDLAPLERERIGLILGKERY
jgi:predicted nucleotidyltransferase